MYVESLKFWVFGDDDGDDAGNDMHARVRQVVSRTLGLLRPLQRFIRSPTVSQNVKIFKMLGINAVRCSAW